MRITKVYTRTGDGGETRLGMGRRVPKDSPRVAAYGTVDELQSALGVVLAANPVDEVREAVARIQNELFSLGSDLCLLEEEKKNLSVPGIEKRHVDALEAYMDGVENLLGPLEEFILPGGAPAAAQLHVARTVCRRAERLVVTLAREEPVGEHVIRYLNRLSDALFVMARHENRMRGVPDVLWKKSM
jgi:cob(I)alamin adenosyltransferase